MRREIWNFTRDGEELEITLYEHPDPTVDPEDFEVTTTDGTEDEQASWDGARDVITQSLIPDYTAKGWTLSRHEPMRDTPEGPHWQWH
ncbi:hypothetical protein OG554_07710 [Streptomyces griseus]|uniref:hypothetical protein n=1 Tax=Streptomyces griseus group TaxID=629295 RepID=UPI003081FE47|nr:hypothetical protein OG554_07710 [Streptomyces fimicarius]